MSQLVFITGASSGIGQALAARYLQAGWRLALAARRTGEIEAWARATGLAPGQYAVYGADVADTQSIVAAGKACIAPPWMTEDEDHFAVVSKNGVL